MPRSRRRWAKTSTAMPKAAPAPGACCPGSGRFGGAITDEGLTTATGYLNGEGTVAAVTAQGLAGQGLPVPQHPRWRHRHLRPVRQRPDRHGPRGSVDAGHLRQPVPRPRASATRRCPPARLAASRWSAARTSSSSTPPRTRTRRSRSSAHMLAEESSWPWARSARCRSCPASWATRICPPTTPPSWSSSRRPSPHAGAGLAEDR